MRKDIIHTDGDLVVKAGDFAVGVADDQHVEDIVIALPGEFKSWPMLGFGAVMQLKKEANKSAFKRDLKTQLAYDGYAEPTIDLSEGFGKLKIEI